MYNGQVARKGCFVYHVLHTAQLCKTFILNILRSGAGSLSGYISLLEGVLISF